jgi:hypothetical protein
MWQVPHAWAIKARQSQVPALWHFGPSDVAAKVKARHRPGWRWFSDDISKYDQSVSDKHQRELAELVIGPLVGFTAAAFKLQWKDLPLLGPPLSTSFEAFLYDKKGMTPSGDLMTALDGTLINFARILHCMAVATGRSLREVLAGRDIWWACLVQGDDTVLGVSGPFDEEKYITASTLLGYGTKMVPGVVFLMHAVDPVSGRWAPLASRVFQQTVFNEYGGTSPAVELFSFIARTPPHFWRDNPWAEEVGRLFSDGECFSRYRVTPFTANSALEDPVFVTDLAADLKQVRARADRFKNVGAAALPRGPLSDVVARLLDDRSEVELPRLQPEDAWLAAQRLASFLALPKEERPDSLPILGGGADEYIHYLQEGKFDNADQEE